MKIKDILNLPTNELSLILEGLAVDSERLKGIPIEYDGINARSRRLNIERKIARISSELRLRGWEAIVYEDKVKFIPIDIVKEQKTLI